MTWMQKKIPAQQWLEPQVTCSYPIDVNNSLAVTMVMYVVCYHITVGSPEEVEEIFDAISYCKGASIIHMLYHWIGDKV